MCGWAGVNTWQSAFQPDLKERYSVSLPPLDPSHLDSLLILLSYVGTLHEINPEASTIALENVQSFGTEGRRGNPAEEVAPSASVYEYIVFRGSDVKDISVAGEEKQENTQPEPPRVPDDPAILGVSTPQFYEHHNPTPIFLACTHRGRAIDQMMNHFGCKHTDLFLMRKTMWNFPLPSF